MFNYIHSELYRAWKKRIYLWLLVGAAVVELVFLLDSGPNILPYLLLNMSSMVIMGLIMFVGIFTFKTRTIQRQILSYGTPKIVVFVGDLLVQTIIVTLYLLSFALICQLYMLIFGDLIPLHLWKLLFLEIIFLPTLILSILSLIYITANSAKAMVLFLFIYLIFVGIIDAMLLYSSNFYLYLLTPWIYCSNFSNVNIYDKAAIGSLYREMFSTYLPALSINSIVNFVVGYLVFKRREY